LVSPGFVLSEWDSWAIPTWGVLPYSLIAFSQLLLQISAGGIIIMWSDVSSSEPDDLLEPLRGKTRLDRHAVWCVYLLMIHLPFPCHPSYVMNSLHACLKNRVFLGVCLS
jgi:hypothetical protein